MKALSYFSIVFLLFQCNNPSQKDALEPQGDLVITNVNVLTMLDDQVLQNYAVIVEEGVIKKLEPAANIDTSAFQQVIDGNGKYLLPGLSEMHAHIPHPDGENDRIEETLFLYLSNGITTIRGMLGHPYHLELREKVENGTTLGPRIYTSGPSFNGNTVQTVDEAVNKAKEQKQAGYDFLKLHPGIKLEVFDAIVNTANEVGIDFAGHVSVDVGIVHALESGYASIDHVDGYLEGLVPESANVNPGENGFFGYNFAKLVDMERLPVLIEMTSENQVWVVTTQSLFTRWASPESADVYLTQPEMHYMPASTLESWKESKNNLISGENYTADQWEKMMDTRKEIIRQLSGTGLLLLGSDAPQVFNVPGFSIHHEIDALQDCGLSNFEILQTGTSKPAVFFEKQGEFGTVETGASADMVLVSGNPLEDLDYLQQPLGVMIRGKWMDREFLDKELQKIAGESSDL